MTKEESSRYLEEHVHPILRRIGSELEPYNCRFAMVVIHEQKCIQVTANTSDIVGLFKWAIGHITKYVMGSPQTGKTRILE